MTIALPKGDFLVTAGFALLRARVSRRVSRCLVLRAPGCSSLRRTARGVRERWGEVEHSGE